MRSILRKIDRVFSEFNLTSSKGVNYSPRFYIIKESSEIFSCVIIIQEELCHKPLPVHVPQ